MANEDRFSSPMRITIGDEVVYDPDKSPKRKLPAKLREKLRKKLMDKKNIIN